MVIADGHLRNHDIPARGASFAQIAAFADTLPYSCQSKGAWSAVARLGYLVAPEYAYALAVFAWLRDERHPHWIGYLRKDVKVPFERTLAYFERSGVSLERFQQTPPDA